MSTPLQESIKRIQHESEMCPEPISGGRGNLRTMIEGTLQGAVHKVPDYESDVQRGASVDIDRESTTRRDRLTPRVQITLPTLSLTGGVPLTIPLPRWARQVIIQNNSDLGGNSATVSRSIDGTPAQAGRFTIRQGQTVSDDVYTHVLSLYSVSDLTINGNAAGGLAIEVSS